MMTFPGKLLLIGDLPRFWCNSTDTLVQVYREQGDGATVRLAGRSFILVVRPEEVRRVLQQKARNYARGYSDNSTLFGNGLLSSEGELWRHRRRMLAPAFHRRSLPAFVEAVVEESGREAARWFETGEPLNLGHCMTRLMNWIVLRFVFGADPAALEGPLGERLVSAFEDAFAGIDPQMVVPFLRHIPLPSNRRFRRAVAMLDAALEEQIRVRHASNELGADFLGMLLAIRGEAGRPLTDREVRDEVVSIYGAGHETTATALCWTFYALSRHPAAAQCVRHEADRVLGDRVASVANLQDLVETRAFVEEVLRLHPPVWMFTRRAVGPDVLAGRKVEAGSLVMLSPFVTHRLPEVWGNPEGFDPARFLPGADEGRPPYAYYPFGGGPHMCIGRHFAPTAATLIVASVSRRYNLDLVGGQEVRVGSKGRVRVSLRPHPGLWAVPRHRNHPKEDMKQMSFRE